MHRDFTYIDDIVEGIVRVMAKPPAAEHEAGQADVAPNYRVYNIGHNHPVELLHLIRGAGK